MPTGKISNAADKKSDVIIGKGSIAGQIHTGRDVILGNQVNILPVLMAIGMFVQQKISMAKATGEAAQQQQMMSIIMPVMFGVIFYQMPSGLVLYWFVNSLFMLGYQFRINKQK